MGKILIYSYRCTLYPLSQKRIMQEYEKLVKKAREDIDRIIQQEATK